MTRRLTLDSLLRTAALVALVLAGSGLLVPGRAGEVMAAVAVALLVFTPLVRVAWLAADWSRAGDRRFAIIAVGLLLVIGSGACLAWLT